MEFERPKARNRPAKKLAKDIKKQINGVFDRVHGNAFQSGWPGHFLFTKELGLKWVQIVIKGGLGWQKLARFRYWHAHGVPIYLIRCIEDLEKLSGEPNWWEAGVQNRSDKGKAIERYGELKAKLAQPPRLHRLEQQIADRVEWKLQQDGWIFEKTFGNRCQSGWPDYYAHHNVHGYRWIEMKRPTGQLEASQWGRFGKWAAFGVKIWVLKSEDEIYKLSEPPNWREFPKKKWKVPIK